MTTPRAGATIGLLGGGLAAYWPQFPDLRPLLEAEQRKLGSKLAESGSNVVDVGFISDEREARVAAAELAKASCDLVVMFLPTYMTATMIAPIALGAQAPLLFAALQPAPSMPHDTVTTGEWLSYCGTCCLPEAANVLERCGVEFRSVSGYLDDSRSWEKINTWVGAASVCHALKEGRHGLMGHLYPGMYDVAADLALIPANFGGHVEVLELDDLRVRVEAVTDSEARNKAAEAREIFEVTDSVDDEDLLWSARVAAGLDRLVADFELGSLAYYYRGLGEELYEALGAGMILGASLLTGRGVPACGEYELRTSLAMLMLHRLGAGGAFTELQALDFDRGHVEMGHDGPGHLGISDRRPVLRGLGVFHGKRGHGVSVEFDVKHGPVTAFCVTQVRNGGIRFVASEGTVVDGPLMKIGNTTSRIDFGCGPGEWCDAWSGAKVSHHWALGTGHRAAELRCVADLLGVEYVQVQP